MLVIPLRAKRVGEFTEIRHNKISPTGILSTLDAQVQVWLAPVPIHSCVGEQHYLSIFAQFPSFLLSL